MEQCYLRTANQRMIQSFTIERPCSSALLAKAVLKIAELGYVFSLEPDLEKVVCYGKKAIDHFPIELREEFLENGQFIIVKNIEDFESRFD